MSDVTSTTDVHWFREGIAHAKKNPDYLFRSSLDGDNVNLTSNLPRIVDECGIDRTPKPLFPIFLKNELDFESREDLTGDVHTKDDEGHSRDPDAVLTTAKTSTFEDMADGSLKSRKPRAMTPELKDSRLTQLWSDQNYNDKRPWLQMASIFLGPDSVLGEDLWDEDVSEQEESEEVVEKEVEKIEEAEVVTKFLEKVGIREREFSLWEEDPFASLTESDKKRAERERLKRETENLKNQEAYSQEWEIAIQNLQQEEIIVDTTDKQAGFTSADAIGIKAETVRTEQWQISKSLKHHVCDVAFARKNIILSETDTMILLDTPDFIVEPDAVDYEVVIKRNTAYDETRERYKSDRHIITDSIVQTLKPKHKDEFVYTGPLQELKDGDGLIDEYSLYETYVESKIIEEDSDPLIKRVQLKDTEAFLKFLENHKNEFLPVLYNVEKAMNQNSYSELISACNKLSELMVAGKKKTLISENQEPALKKLLSITSKTANGRHSVTCICFNFVYPYYFAAGFDTTSAPRLIDEMCSPGCIVCWDIRHFQIPEIVFNTPEVVTCLEFSKRTPYLLAAGMRNGLLAIFDISKTEVKPLIDNYLSSDRPYGDIGSLRWSSLSQKRNEITCVSLEGKIYQWLPGAGTRANVLKGNGDSKTGVAVLSAKSDVALNAVVPYLCLDLKPENPEICLVGTITGEVVQSTVFGDTIQSHNKHCGPVYETRWSPIVKDVFLSCGFDTSVCLWDASKPEPCRTFFMNKGEPVINLDWSNTSSTFFGVVTPSEVTVFDLSLNTVSGLETISLDDSNPKFTCLTFFPHGNWFFVGRSDGVIDVYDAINVPTSHDNAEDALRSAFL